MKDKYNQKITKILNDRIDKHALLMCLMQIGETLNKIDTDTNSILKEYQKGAYNVRNFIAHDYEGVNMAIIENIVRDLLSPLKDEISKTLKKVSSK